MRGARETMESREAMRARAELVRMARKGKSREVCEPKTISVLVCVCVCACVSAHEHIYVQRGRNSRHTQFICFISHGIMSC